MEELLYTVNGRKYLLMEVLVVAGSNTDKIKKVVKDFECITQGIKQIDSGGFFKKAYGVIRVLVPEEKAKEFGELDL